MRGAARPWYRRPVGWFALAVATHLACVFAVPWLVMAAAMSRLAAATGGINQAQLAPPTEASSRRIVMPSPDMRYAVCVYDLASGPVLVEANPQWSTYWSVALYDARTDNYRSWNDRELRGRGLRLLLVPRQDGSFAAATADATLRVVSPTRRGVVLMRLLVAGQSQRGLEVPTQVLKCGPHSGVPG